MMSIAYYDTHMELHLMRKCTAGGACTERTPAASDAQALVHSE